MTYSKDREPLLHKDGHTEDDFGSEGLKQFAGMFETCFASPVHFYYVKKERFLPRAVILIFAFVCGLFAVDQYRISMRSVESHECHDVLSDCEGVAFNRTLVPPFYNYLEDFTITRRYDISLCLIPKVMSTVGTAALCYIEDPSAFASARRSISNEMYDGRFCERNEMKSFEMVKHNLKQKFENVIVVRDPFDRFISGFTEKCVNYARDNHCHGCGTDIRCFIRKEYRRLMRISMLFPVYSTADTHFAPQSWFCNMKATLTNSTVIRYSNSGTERERMIDDIVRVFQKQSVPEKDIEEVRKELSKGKTQHSTAGSDLRRKYENLIREDESIRRALVRMYFYDFLLFGYPM